MRELTNSVKYWQDKLEMESNTGGGEVSVEN